MRNVDDVWEYIVVYVNDITIAMKDASNVQFIMEGVGTLTTILGVISSVMTMAHYVLFHIHIKSVSVLVLNLSMGSH